MCILIHFKAVHAVADPGGGGGAKQTPPTPFSPKYFKKSPKLAKFLQPPLFTDPGSATDMYREVFKHQDL